MIGNAPLREISERLYFLTNRAFGSNRVPHLNLRDEIAVFRREVADILAAMEWEISKPSAISGAATSP